MSRTRVTLAAAVLATGAFAVPAALAGPHCTSPVAGAIHTAEDAVKPVSPDVARVLHDVEGRYCQAGLPV